MDKETLKLLDDWIAEYREAEEHLTKKIDGPAYQHDRAPWLKSELCRDRANIRVLIDEFEKFREKAK